MILLSSQVYSLEMRIYRCIAPQIELFLAETPGKYTLEIEFNSRNYRIENPQVEILENNLAVRANADGLSFSYSLTNPQGVGVEVAHGVIEYPDEEKINLRIIKNNTLLIENYLACRVYDLNEKYLDFISNFP